ncbi:MAG: MFS transporter [Rhizobiales bacterium]|nr:MFS transporter [Hyphomicrobiales bacterium]
MSEHPFRWLILFGCWSLYFVFGLSIAGLAPLVVTIVAELQLTSAQMGTVLGAWQFIYIFAAIPVGLTLHKFGPGRLLLLAGAIIVASGFLRAEAQSYAGLLVSVALFGLGGPIISAGIPQVVSRWFTGKERGLAMGVYITGPALAGVVAYSSTQSALMPWLDNDWRAVLRVWAWAAIAATFLWAVIWMLSRRHVKAQEAAAAVVFDWRHLWDILHSRDVLILLTIGAGIFTIDHGLRNWIPEIVRAAGWSPAEAGYLAVIPVVMGIISALILPRLATPQRRLRVLQLLFGSAVAGCLLISTGLTVPVIAGLAAAGLASGAMMTITILTLIELPVVGPQRSGLAGGLYFSVAEIGGVGGPVLIGVMRDATGGFQVALIVLATLGCGLVALSRILSGASR